MIDLFSTNKSELAEEIGELYAQFINCNTLVHGEIMKGRDIKKWAEKTYNFDYGISNQEDNDDFIALIFTESKSYAVSDKEKFISGFIRTKGFHDAQVIDPYDNQQCEFFSLMHATKDGFRKAILNIQKEFC